MDLFYISFSLYRAFWWISKLLQSIWLQRFGFGRQIWIEKVEIKRWLESDSKQTLGLSRFNLLSLHSSGHVVYDVLHCWRRSEVHILIGAKIFSIQFLKILSINFCWVQLLRSCVPSIWSQLPSISCQLPSIWSQIPSTVIVNKEVEKRERDGKRRWDGKQARVRKSGIWHTDFIWSHLTCIVKFYAKITWTELNYSAWKNPMGRKTKIRIFVGCEFEKWNQYQLI